MSGGYSKEQKARTAQKAEQIFAAEERVRMAIDEAHDAMIAKTARFRELRLAKEAAERATAPQKKPKQPQ